MTGSRAAAVRVLALVAVGLAFSYPAVARHRSDAIQQVKRRIFLPLVVKNGQPQRAATARPPTAWPSPTARPRTATPTATGRTPTARPATATPTTRPATPTPTATASPSPSASLPEPSATAGSPPPTAMPSPTPTPLVRDPESERLIPWAATLAGTAALEASADGRRFTWRFNGPIKVAYLLDLDHPDNRAGRLTIEEAESGKVPLAGGGLIYRRLDGSLDDEPRLVDAKSVVITPVLTAGVVTVTTSELIEGLAHVKSFALRLVGAALEVSARSLDPPGKAKGAYAGFSAGTVEGSNDGVNVRVPFMDAVPVTMLDHRWFAGTLLDYPRSHATTLSPQGPASLPGSGFRNGVDALYDADTAGNLRPVSETLWVVVSPKVEHLFPLPSAPPAPALADLRGRAHVLVGPPNAQHGFADTAALLNKWSTWGITQVVATLPSWTDAATLPPGLGPPDPRGGGAAGWAGLAQAARQTGARLVAGIGLTLTVAGCSDQPNPLYRADDRVLDASGAPKAIGDDVNPWQCPDGSANTAYLLASDAAHRVARDSAPLLLGLGFGGALALDIGNRNPTFPWPAATTNVLDADPASTHPHDLGAAIAGYKALLAQMQASMGPVLSDGPPSRWPEGYDSLYAGYVDGGLRALATGADDSPGAAYIVAPDYELRVARSRTVGFGLGTYARFWGLGRFAGPAMAPTATLLTEVELDAWRARELAYGHAGAWEAFGGSVGAASPLLADADLVKEYFLLQALQRRYLSSADVTVGYSTVEATEIDLSGALQRDLDLSGTRLHLRYGPTAAFEIYVNLSADPWTLRLPAGNAVLPANGWLARENGETIGYSATVGGRRVDWLKTPEIELADGRGASTDFGDLVATNLVVRLADGRRIAEQADGSISVTP